MSPGRPESGYDILQAYGYDVLSDYLRLEHDLLARFVDYEEMDDYPEISAAIDIYCLAENTPVAIPGKIGQSKTIGELYQEAVSGKRTDLYVYAFDHEKARVVVAKATGPKKTGEKVPVFKVTYEDYRCKRRWSIRATANHLFMLRHGQYAKLKDLGVGARLMPCTFKIGSDGYQVVYEPLQKTSGSNPVWTPVHPLVAATTLGRDFAATEEVHHRDLDRSNAAPENLEVLTKIDHVHEHVFVNPAGEARRAKKITKSVRTQWTDPKFKLQRARAHLRDDSNWLQTEEESKRFQSQGVLSDVHRAAIARGRTIPLSRDVVEATVRASASLNYAAKQLGVSWNTLVRRLAQFDLDRGMLGSNLNGPRPGEVGYGNHRVVSIEPDGFEDVFDLEVPGYHNFAAGGADGSGFIFVHNSDDASQPDTIQRRSIWATSADYTIEQILDDLYHRTLRLDEEIWEISRTVTKYGNDYEEVLVSPDGVIGLNFLPPPTVRRIEGPRGELFGFVQDFKGRFGFSPEEFRQILATRTSMLQGGAPDAAQAGYGGFDKVAALEDWEVVHFRLRGKHRRSIYGYCCRKSNKINTLQGLKEIQHICVGDVVQVYDGFKMAEAKVLNVVCSGKKKVFSIKTRHRETFATAEHPVFVFSDSGPQWKPVAELVKGDRLVVPAPVEPEGILTRIKNPEEFSCVRLTARGVSLVQQLRGGERYFYQKQGLNDLGIRDVDQVLSGTVSTDRKSFDRLAQALPILREPETVVLHKPNRENFVQCPEFVDEKFARLLGFMLGDGWIHGTQVTFALGLDESINQRYRNQLEEYGLRVTDRTSKRVDEQTGEVTRVATAAYACSADLEDILRGLGWIDGAHNKRIPPWVFESSRLIREEFLFGFVDADGWDVNQYGQETMRIEVCNYDLARDLKSLVDGLGWTCGNVCVRQARVAISTHPALNGKGAIHSGPGYILSFSTKPLFDGPFRLEQVLKVTEQDTEAEDVYDIEVDHPAHNFVSDGIVVSNSVLEPARWIWKRLMLLEDAALVFRLQRAPERYAFYVDVGDLPPAEALAYVNRMRQQHKKQKFVNPTTGKLDLKFDPLAQDEDFFIPVRKDTNGTKIEVLAAPAWQHMDDIEYFRDKLFAAIKVPKAYMGQEDGVARAVLSSEDVRFARTVLRIQRELRNGMGKISRVHLAALNIDPQSVDYDIHMTVPSAIFELAQLEVRNARADFANRMKEFVSHYWLLSHVFGMNDHEIEQVIKQRGEDIERNAEEEAVAAAKAQKVAVMYAPVSPEVERNTRYEQIGLSRNFIDAINRKKSNGITEEELFRGNREAERRASDKLDKMLRNDALLQRRVRDLGGLLTDLRGAVFTLERSGTRSR